MIPKAIRLLVLALLAAASAFAQKPAPSLAEQRFGTTYEVENAIPGKRVYISIQRPYNSQGKIVGNNLVSQGKQVFENLKDGLAPFGLTLQDVVQIKYITVGDDRNSSQVHRQQLDGMISNYLPQSPNRIEESKSIPKIMHDDVLIEIEAIAIKQ